MQFIVIALDRGDAGDMRKMSRSAHLEFVANRQDHIKCGGPILFEGGHTVGSLLILDFPDRASLDSHLASDPYFNSNLFEAVFIRRTRQVVPETEPGQLAEEIARQKNL